MQEARYHKVPCYFNRYTNEIEGKNWFYEILVRFWIWFDLNIALIDEFEIKIKEGNQNEF